MNIGFTPVNQVRLTNVAYVRLQKKGKRFEIACYRNKVLNWRNKIETDLSEVLQIDTVFTNVSKGNLASSKDLLDAFGTSDQKQVCKEILDKGELQVSEQERGALYESVYRDVASIVADKTINSDTGRPYTISMIQNAMKQIQYSISVSKNSKSQALDVIRKLRDIMPIVRANMQLRVICFAAELDLLRSDLAALGAVVLADSSVTPLNNSSSSSGESAAVPASVEVRVDPEAFRRVEEVVQERTAGLGRVEVVQLRVANSYATTNIAVAPGSQLHQQQDAPSASSVAESGGSSGNVGADKVTASKSTSIARREQKDQQRASAIEGLLRLSGVEEGKDGADRSSSDDEDGNLEAIGIARKQPKKRGTRAAGRAKLVVLAEEQQNDDVEENDYEEDNDDDDDDDENAADEHGDDDLRLALAMSASMSVASSEQGSVRRGGGSGGGDGTKKKGKKSRRAEKEEQRDRETKAAAVRQRAIAQQQQQLQQQESLPATIFGAIVPAAAAAAAGDRDSQLQPQGKTQSCNTCGGAFRDATEYRSHFRSEWHRYNLSRKMKGLSLVQSEEAFLGLSLEELAL